MSERIVICWVDPGNVAGRFMASVLLLNYFEQRRAEATKTPTRYAGHLRLESGPRIATARNTLVRSFLDDERFTDSVDWLLMLDADMTFDEDLCDRLLDGAYDAKGELVRPLIGGLCFGGGHEYIFPTLYEMVDPKINNNNPVRVISEFKPGEAVKVDATGAACLLMHRSVLDAMRVGFPEPTPWFAEGQYAGKEFGEDWTFSVRAGRLGFPIYVNTGAQIGHLKTVEMNDAMWRTGRTNLKSLELPVTEHDVATIIPINREQRRRAARTTKV